MPMVIGFRGAPVMPAEVKPLHSGVVTADGKWAKPDQIIAINIKGKPEGWDFKFEEPNKYTVTHNLGTLMYSVEIASATGGRTEVQLGENSFTVELYDKHDSGAPMAQSFRYALREHHL